MHTWERTDITTDLTHFLYIYISNVRAHKPNDSVEDTREKIIKGMMVDFHLASVSLVLCITAHWDKQIERSHWLVSLVTPVLGQEGWHQMKLMKEWGAGVQKSPLGTTAGQGGE